MSLALIASGCANDPPKADFTLNPNPTAGQAVTFDGSASNGGRNENDQPLRVDRWEWDLDGNGSFEKTTWSPTVTHTYEGTKTVEVGLRVVNERNVASAATTRTVATSEQETAATPVGADCDLGAYDHYACGSQRLSGSPLGAEDETLNAGPRPDFSRSPSFKSFFGGGFSGITGDEGVEQKQPENGSQQLVGFGPHRVAVATGADRVFVLDYQNRVRRFDSTSLADLGSFFAIDRARDIAFYRGELYVLAADGDVAVFDPDGAPKRVLRMVHPAGATTLLEEATSWSLTVAWGEVWSSLSLGEKRGDALLVRDAKTGTPKSAGVHYARSWCTATVVDFTNGRERCVDATPFSTEPSGDWPKHWLPGISAVPEWWSIVSQCRVFQRNNFKGLTYGVSSGAPSPVEGVPICSDGGVGAALFGTDAVWGRSHFLQMVQHADNRAEVQEYTLYGRSNGTVDMAPARTWRPAQTGGYRDIAYRTRETTIDWSGALTKDPSDWLRSPNNTEDKCLHYVVSDADIYVVGPRGERWYELAQGLNRVDLLVDGVVRKTSTLPEGDFCLNTRTLAGGIRRLEVKAYLSNPTRTVGAVNPNLRIDNAAPSGQLVEPRLNPRGTVRFTGTIADDHSGGGSWALEVQQDGQSTWRQVCAGRPAEEGRYACSWNTADGQSPDGEYRIRARLTDAASDGGNGAYSEVWDSVIVANAPPPDESTSIYDDMEEDSAGLPETFNEEPEIDDVPDESGDMSPSGDVAYACAPDDPYDQHLDVVYGLAPGADLLGSPSELLEIQVFTALPGVPHVPLAAFTKHEESADFTTWVARENGNIVASIQLDKLPGGGYLADGISGCSTFLARYSAPDPTGTSTGVAPVDGATGAAESGAAGLVP